MSVWVRAAGDAWLSLSSAGELEEDEEKWEGMEVCAGEKYGGFGSQHTTEIQLRATLAVVIRCFPFVASVVSFRQRALISAWIFNS